MLVLKCELLVPVIDRGASWAHGKPNFERLREKENWYMESMKFTQDKLRILKSAMAHYHLTVDTWVSYNDTKEISIKKTNQEINSRVKS